jgi:hypothetical protein
MAGDLADWADYCEPGRLTDGIARLRTDPRLPEILRRIVAATLARSDEEPAGTAAFPDAGSVMVGLVVLSLEAVDGFTHNRLRRTARAAGLMSAGRASSVLARLRSRGYVLAAELTAAGRVRRYAVSERMVAEWRRRFLIELEPLQLLDPAAGEAVRRLDTREGVIAFAFRFAALQAALLPTMPASLLPFFTLIERNVAIHIVMALLQASDTGGSFPSAGAVAELSVASLARRFEVSRVQVRRVLRDMEVRSYITRAKPGTVRIEQALMSDFSNYFCALLIGFAHLARSPGEADR